MPANQTRKTVTAAIVPGRRASFGESPFFDPRDGSIVCVDTRGHIIQHRPDETWTSWDVPEAISFAVPSALGGFLVGLAQRGICRFNPHDSSLDPLDIRLPAGHQSNDATVDALGGLVFGTRSSDKNAFDGALIVCDAQGSRVVADGFGLINGLAVDPVGGRLFIADTHPDSQKVWVCQYDLATGALGARQQLFDFHDRPGRPDGAALDAAGNLWLAEIGGSALVCLAPTGELLAEIELPVSMPTKPCFDGRGRLVVTTASRGVDLVREPAAGQLLALDVPGASIVPIAAI